jgi:hypothetical protein
MSANEDLWGDLLAHLKQRVLLPVVGPKLVTVLDGDGRPITLARRIGERLAERCAVAVDWRDEASLDDAVCAYLAARGRDGAERLYRLVNDVLAELNPAVPEPLRQLAGITDLSLFISTTFDSLLARAINDVRFRGEPVTRELWFSPNQSTTEQQANTWPPAADEPVVFRLFGKASSMPQYAIHQEDVLEWLHALLTETARLPEWLGDRLKESPLLFVGCQIPDWVGRFLVRLASRTRLSFAGNQVFIVDSNLARQPALTAFFTTFCGSARVQCLDADPVAFVAELRERWAKGQPATPVARAIAAAAAPSTRGQIFISYVREDVTAARRLCEAISEMGGDVWLDERRLQPGDRWEREILEALQRDVRLFVPLISRHTEQRGEGYVFKEWGEAVESRKRIAPGRRFIMPIVIDLDYDGNPARYRQVPREFMELHFGRAPGGVPDADLAALLTEEIRAMRRSERA